MAALDAPQAPPDPVRAMRDAAFPSQLLGAALNHPARLAALKRTALMDTAPDPVFDRFTRLVRFALNVPVALISLVDHQRQFFKSALGLPPEWDARRGTPLSHCFCQYAVATREPFQTTDARTHPWVCDNGAVRDLNVVAYLGVPIEFYGQTIGTLVAIDGEPREWSEAQHNALRDLAQLLQREIRNRDVQVELAEMARKIEAERLRQQTLIQTMSESVFGMEVGGRLQALNQAARRSGLAEPDRLGQIHVEPLLKRALAGELLHEHVVEVASNRVTSRWHSLNATPLKDPTGAITGAVLVGRDISDARQAAQLLKQQTAEIDDLYEHAPCGYQSIDGNHYFVRINQTLLDWLGYTREELIGKRKLAEFLRPEFRERAWLIFEDLMRNGRVHDVRYELQRRDGSWLSVMSNASAVYDESGRFLMSRSTLIDFTRMELAEQQLQRLMLSDPLTGARNRRGFFQAFDPLLLDSERGGLLLVYVDLDGLKPINDSLGHQAGDLAISAAAQLLRNALGPAAIVARMGGDEFAAALPCASPLVAAGLLDAIESARAAFNREATQHFQLDWSLGHVQVSAGVHESRNVDELLAEVDSLMYLQKRSRRARR